MTARPVATTTATPTRRSPRPWGGGCLPGWVTAERERAFGPDGGNAEIEGLRADLATALAAVDADLARMRDLQGRIDVAIAGLTDRRADIAKLDKRLSAIVRAVGPKAGA